MATISTLYMFVEPLDITLNSRHSAALISNMAKYILNRCRKGFIMCEIQRGFYLTGVKAVVSESTTTNVTSLRTSSCCIKGNVVGVLFGTTVFPDKIFIANSFVSNHKL